MRRERCNRRQPSDLRLRYLERVPRARARIPRAPRRRPGARVRVLAHALAYLRIATHPSVFARPLSSREAVANLTSLLGLPHIRSPGEDPDFWTAFGTVVDEVAPRGNLVPDAHIVALMRSYGVDGIWTRDRDFLKFDGVRVLDPFAPGRASR